MIEVVVGGTVVDDDGPVEVVGVVARVVSVAAPAIRVVEVDGSAGSGVSPTTGGAEADAALVGISTVGAMTLLRT
jgi:hypothetical protein